MSSKIGNKSPPFIQIFFRNLCPFFRKEISFPQALVCLHLWSHRLHLDEGRNSNIYDCIVINICGLVDSEGIDVLSYHLRVLLVLGQNNWVLQSQLVPSLLFREGELGQFEFLDESESLLHLFLHPLLVVSVSMSRHVVFNSFFYVKFHLI